MPPKITNYDTPYQPIFANSDDTPPEDHLDDHPQEVHFVRIIPQAGWIALNNPLPPSPPPSQLTRIKEAITPVFSHLGTCLGVSFCGCFFSKGLAAAINIPLKIMGINSSDFVSNMAILWVAYGISQSDDRSYSWKTRMQFIARQVTVLSMFLFFHYQIFSTSPSEFLLPFTAMHLDAHLPEAILPGVVARSLLGLVLSRGALSFGNAIDLNNLPSAIPPRNTTELFNLVAGASMTLPGDELAFRYTTNMSKNWKYVAKQIAALTMFLFINYKFFPAEYDLIRIPLLLGVQLLFPIYIQTNDFLFSASKSLISNIYSISKRCLSPFTQIPGITFLASTSMRATATFAASNALLFASTFLPRGFFDFCLPSIVPTSLVLPLGLFSLRDERFYSSANATYFLAKQVTTVAMFLLMFHKTWGLELLSFSDIASLFSTQILTPLIFDSLVFIKNPLG